MDINKMQIDAPELLPETPNEEDMINMYKDYLKCLKQDFYKKYKKTIEYKPLSINEFEKYISEELVALVSKYNFYFSGVLAKTNKDFSLDIIKNQAKNHGKIILYRNDTNLYFVIFCKKVIKFCYIRKEDYLNRIQLINNNRYVYGLLGRLTKIYQNILNEKLDQEILGE